MPHCLIDEHSDPLVLAMHGFGGVGKTALCTALWDFYFLQFHGKVGLIDLCNSADTNYHQLQMTYSDGPIASNRLRIVLSSLTNFKVPHDQLRHSHVN